MTPGGPARRLDRRWASLCGVNIFEALLIFVAVPFAVIAVVYLLTVVPARVKARPKHLPGADWDFSDRFYTGDTAVIVPAHLADSPLGGARGTW